MNKWQGATCTSAQNHNTGVIRTENAPAQHAPPGRYWPLTLWVHTHYQSEEIVSYSSLPTCSLGGSSRFLSETPTHQLSSGPSGTRCSVGLDTRATCSVTIEATSRASHGRRLDKDGNAHSGQPQSIIHGQIQPNDATRKWRRGCGCA